MGVGAIGSGMVAGEPVVDRKMQMEAEIIASCSPLQITPLAHIIQDFLIPGEEILWNLNPFGRDRKHSSIDIYHHLQDLLREHSLVARNEGSVELDYFLPYRIRPSKDENMIKYVRKRISALVCLLEEREKVEVADLFCEAMNDNHPLIASLIHDILIKKTKTEENGGADILLQAAYDQQRWKRFEWSINSRWERLEWIPEYLRENRFSWIYRFNDLIFRAIIESKRLSLLRRLRDFVPPGLITEVIVRNASRDISVTSSILRGQHTDGVPQDSSGLGGTMETCAPLIDKWKSRAMSKNQEDIIRNAVAENDEKKVRELLDGKDCDVEWLSNLLQFDESVGIERYTGVIHAILDIVEDDKLLRGNSDIFEWERQILRSRLVILHNIVMGANAAREFRVVNLSFPRKMPIEEDTERRRDSNETLKKQVQILEKRLVRILYRNT